MMGIDKGNLAIRLKMDPYYEYRMIATNTQLIQVHAGDTIDIDKLKVATELVSLALHI